MSVQAVGWALSVNAGSTAAKCVLITLANYADADGLCWPSQALIAKQTEQSIDTVQRRIKDLEAERLISRVERREQKGKRGGLYLYQLSMPKAEIIQAVETTPQSAARFGRNTNHTAGETKPHRTVAASNEPKEPIKGKKDSKVISGKREKPRHLAKNKDRVWCDVGTDEWKAYAEDFRAAHGRDPPMNWENRGSWFNLLGEGKAA